MGPKINFRAFKIYRQGPSVKFNREGGNLVKFAHFGNQIYIK